MYEAFVHTIIERDSSAYPSILLDLGNPPDFLYCIGDTSLLAMPCFSVVGARKATPYGIGLSSMFAKRAAEMGLVVVSGGAMGCDQAAARAALGVDGKTIVVLGGGADVVYPSNALPLFLEVLEKGGLLISENPWGSAALPSYFVLRNRIIAGLSKATLIVEAGLNSGTFHTADAALNCGREVLVVPGSIHSPQSQGSNRLLYQGAYPICDILSFDEIIRSIYPLELLEIQQREISNVNKGLEGLEKKVMEALSANPMRMEDLIFSLQADAVRLACILSDFEGRGMLVRDRTGRWAVPVMLKAV